MKRDMSMKPNNVRELRTSRKKLSSSACKGPEDFEIPGHHYIRMQYEESSQNIYAIKYLLIA